MGGEQTRKIRDKLATISIPYEGENNPIVFSYYYKYEKYLRDNNLVDVSRNLEKKLSSCIFHIYLSINFQPEKAKIIQEKVRRKQQLTKDNEKNKAENKDNPAAKTKDKDVLDGEDLSEMEKDDSYPGVMSGKHRFDNLIKTMIARIEYNNTLAPVQDYGRHQTRALKKKKKVKQENEEAEGVEDPTKAKGKRARDFDDKFYDLDDEFIDDGDMEDGYGNGLDQMGGPGAYDDFMEDAGTSMTNGQGSLNVEYDPQMTDERKEQEREKKKYAQIVKRFRIIMPEEVEKMLQGQTSNQIIDGQQGSSPPKRPNDPSNG